MMGALQALIFAVLALGGEYGKANLLAFFAWTGRRALGTSADGAKAVSR